MVIHSSREWLGIQWVKVTLYFHLREHIVKRLHYGLSETILVNTLTDVREFKNAITVLQLGGGLKVVGIFVFKWVAKHEFTFLCKAQITVVQNTEK